MGRPMHRSIRRSVRLSLILRTTLASKLDPRGSAPRDSPTPSLAGPRSAPLRSGGRARGAPGSLCGRLRSARPGGTTRPADTGRGSAARPPRGGAPTAGCCTTSRDRTERDAPVRPGGRRRDLPPRRWYYLIPAEGEPRGLVHAIERHNLDGLPGERPVCGARSARQRPARAAAGRQRVAIESRQPTTSPTFPESTPEPSRQSGSSASTSVSVRGYWCSVSRRSDPPRRSRRTGPRIDALYRIKDQAFDLVRSRLKSNTPVTDTRSSRQCWAGSNVKG